MARRITAHEILLPCLSQTERRFLLTAGRHEVLTKEILELDPADGVWTAVERRAAMHDSYDVCVVAKLRPGGLLTA